MKPNGTVLMLTEQPLQNVFRGLADPTRRQILLLLAENEMTIGDVADRFPVTRAAIKKHLVVLEQGGLISVHRRGREQVNRYNPLALKMATSWLQQLDQFWDQRLHDLKTAIENGE